MRASGSPGSTTGGATAAGATVVVGAVEEAEDGRVVVSRVVVGAGVVAMMLSNSFSSLFCARASWMPVPHSWYTTNRRMRTPAPMSTRPMPPTTHRQSRDRVFLAPSGLMRPVGAKRISRSWGWGVEVDAAAVDVHEGRVPNPRIVAFAPPQLR